MFKVVLTSIRRKLLVQKKNEDNFYTLLCDLIKFQCNKYILNKVACVQVYFKTKICDKYELLNCCFKILIYLLLNQPFVDIQLSHDSSQSTPLSLNMTDWNISIVLYVNPSLSITNTYIPINSYSIYGIKDTFLEVFQQGTFLCKVITNILTLQTLPRYFKYMLKYFCQNLKCIFILSPPETNKLKIGPI